MTFTRFTVPLLAALILAGPMATPSTAQETASRWQWSSPLAVTTDPWKFSAEIWGWLPSAPMDIEHKGQSIHLPESLTTIIDALLFAAMGHGEVHKGPFGVFLTPVYYKGKINEDISGGPLGEDRKVTLEESAWFINYGASYDLGTLRLGDEPDSPTVTLQPFAGGSFLHDNIKLDVSPGEILPAISTRSTITFNTPIFGLNTHWDLSDRWSLRIGGYYGGFGVDDVNGTYQVTGFIDYHVKVWDQPARVFAGYRHVHLNYDDNDEFDIKVNITGPVIGFGVDF